MKPGVGIWRRRKSRGANRFHRNRLATRKVGLHVDAPAFVQVDALPAFPLAKTQGFPKGDVQELLEHHVHIDEKRGAET